MSEEPIRIVVADDHPLMRDGVVRTLVESGRFDVVAEAANGPDAVKAAAAHKPQMVLLDVSMPGGGINALIEIMKFDVPPKVAMLTVSEEDDDIMRAVSAGAAGYVLKGVGAGELVEILVDLAAGRSYVSPGLAMKMLSAMRAAPTHGTEENPLETLTKREEDILRLVAQGNSNKEVAIRLDIQEKTVKHYMTAILSKLQVRNRTEAALMARHHWEN